MLSCIWEVPYAHNFLAQITYNNKNVELYLGSALCT
jgi:hypothetical protein